MVYIPSSTTFSDFNGCESVIGARTIFKTLFGNVVAIIMYISCFIYLPAIGLVKYVDDQYKHIASVLSYVLFVLVIWTTFTYHYYLIGGGIKFAAPHSWELRATGFFMVTSPKLHRMMTFFGLITSVLAAYHCLTLNFLMDKFISVAKWDHDVMFKGCFLKVHFTLCILVASYSIFRIIQDPKIIEARNRFLSEGSPQQPRQQLALPSVSAEGWPTVSTSPQECSICTQRAANRQLRCGHVMCCCCIARIASTKACVTCPFCRMEVFNARKLLVEPEIRTVPLSHCDSCGCKDDEKNEENREVEPIIEHRRESVESHDDRRDGATALLLPMPDMMPNMGI